MPCPAGQRVARHTRLLADGQAEGLLQVLQAEGLLQVLQLADGQAEGLFHVLQIFFQRSTL
jgi:hypothetical protein